MTKTLDLAGHRYGRLLVQSQAPSSKDGKARWHCLCDCGAPCVVAGKELRSDKTKSCGCLRRETTSKQRGKNLEGHKIGRLLIVKRVDKNRQGNYTWLCNCDCGKSKIISSLGLLSGGTKSCGCLKAEAASERMAVDMRGRLYGRLTAIEQAGTGAFNRLLWRFRCECGQEVIRSGVSVRNCGTRSCGCLRVETSREWGKLIGPKHLCSDGLEIFAQDPAYAERECSLYLAQVATSFLKIGIAFNVKRRGRGDYEAVLFEKRMGRACCWVVEQTALDMTRSYSTQNVPRHLKCEGYSEFREGLPAAMGQVLLHTLSEEVLRVGWAKFAQRYQAGQVRAHAISD
jgi:hypothetical protein